MLLSEKLKDAGDIRKRKKIKEGRFLTYWEEEEEDRTHLVEEKETLPKPQTVKNEIGIYGGLRCLSKLPRSSLWKWIPRQTNRPASSWNTPGPALLCKTPSLWEPFMPPCCVCVYGINLKENEQNTFYVFRRLRTDLIYVLIFNSKGAF